MIYENVMQAVFLSRPNRFLARVLLNGPLPVKVIAERCGFPKLRTFYAAFRRRCSSIQTPWPREGKQNTR